jgi:hypothetical protein
MQNFKKVHIYLFCIALVTIVFNGCKKDNDNSSVNSMKVIASYTVDNVTGESA